MDTIKCSIPYKAAATLDVATIKRTVLNSLASVGFADIQPDWITVSFISQAQMENECEGAAGFHRVNGIYDEIIKVVGELNLTDVYACLAHEYLHAWQKQNRLWEFEHYHENAKAKNLCEGFAQMGAYLLYKKLGDNGDFHAQIMVKQMFSDARPDYGISFQKIHARYQQIGWAGIIKEARQHKLNID